MHGMPLFGWSDEGHFHVVNSECHSFYYFYKCSALVDVSKWKSVQKACDKFGCSYRKKSCKFCQKRVGNDKLKVEIRTDNNNKDWGIRWP